MIQPANSTVLPTGIDPLIWDQAKLDNPNPEELIPVPMIGFTELHNRLRHQEQQTKLHQSRLNVRGSGRGWGGGGGPEDDTSVHAISQIRKHSFMCVNVWTFSRALTLSLGRAAHPFRAALHKWCYFVCRTWAPIKVDQSYGLACHALNVSVRIFAI